MTAPGADPIEAVTVRIEPAFLDGFERGRRFGVWVAPPEGVATLGAILCIQPFCDEATLARRVLSAQARRLALRGWTTLIFDPFGTGDADGDTVEATLGQWRSDLLRAGLLARERAPGRFVLWGTRMGALLAAELVAALDQTVSAAVFWQPAAAGSALIDPLLKLADVGAMARQRAATHQPSTDDSTQAAAESPQEPSEQLLLAGYLLRRDLVDALAGLTMLPPERKRRTASCPVLLLGIQRVLAPNGAAPQPLATLAQQWFEAGHLATLRAVQGEPFWSSLEPSIPRPAFAATETFLDTVAAAGPESGGTR